MNEVFYFDWPHPQGYFVQSIESILIYLPTSLWSVDEQGVAVIDLVEEVLVEDEMMEKQMGCRAQGLFVDALL